MTSTVLVFPTPTYFMPPLMAFPLEGHKGSTRMMGLPDGQKSFKIGLAVYMQYRCATDRQPSFENKDRTIHSVVQVKMK